jgi:Tfp pilus assembly protein PilW
MYLALARLRGERGFTLIELLVAILAGIVVAAAAGAILITSTHLTSSSDDRVDANQQGRFALERITQALNSSCISPSVTPVLSGSTATSLSFYSSQGLATPDAPLITPNEITVSLAGSQTAPGALTLTTQPLTGTNNNWTATGSATNFTLISYAMQTVQSGTTLPLFSYYGYASNDTPTSQIAPGSGGLTSTQAADVVMVTINFAALPTDDWNALGRAADFNDSVVLRLTPASSAASASNSPCT